MPKCTGHCGAYVPIEGQMCDECWAFYLKKMGRDSEALEKKESLSKADKAKAMGMFDFENQSQ